MVPTKQQLLNRLKRRLHERSLSLRIRLWDGSEEVVGSNPVVGLTLASRRAALNFFNPDFGRLAMAYVEGDIDFNGPIAEVIAVAERLTEHGNTFRASAVRRWLPFLHSRKRDARAIAYHYDASNDFYRLWLDRNMIYSCAYFKNGSEDIHVAQEQKLEHICRKLQLHEGERFLDIGCGWGGLICWAAKHYGVLATGITLSNEQYRYCVDRIAKEGLTGRVAIRLQDYREIRGADIFDKIASIGMFEHVGIKRLPGYFGTIYRLLCDGGLVLNHGITTRDTGNGSVRAGGSRFIDRYVFPDGELPHLSVAIAGMEKQHFEVFDAEGMRPHYAQTLMHWVARLEQNREKAVAIVGEKRYRIWHIYLAGCAHAFERGWVSVFQLLAAKRAPTLTTSQPWTRDYIDDVSIAARAASPRWLPDGHDGCEQHEGNHVLGAG